MSAASGSPALAAGATAVLAVDGSAPALALAERGAGAGGVAARFETRKADAFEAMVALAGEGRRFGVVVCDPPAFAPNKGALDAGLRAYERVARLGAALVEPDGFLVLCSCSHAADLARFREASLRGVAKAGRSAQILHVGGAGPDHPVHPALAETAYLKALFLRLGRDPRERCSRRLRPVPAGDARDAGRRGGARRLRAAVVGAHPRGMGAGDAAAARGRRGGGAGGDRAAARRASRPPRSRCRSRSSTLLSLPDPDDRHVLAAAIAGGADTLVTLNRADFPTRTLARHGVLLREPDGFLVELLAGGTRPRAASPRRRGAGARPGSGRC